MASSHILWISKTVIENIMDKISRLTKLYYVMIIQWTLDISNTNNSKYVIKFIRIH